MRIIGGSAGGRRFDAPGGWDTRPTTDRVKESMFAMLHFDLPGARVLDLFAGSGSLSFEALSRGAQHVFANDADRDCAALIKKNAHKLGFSERIGVSLLGFEACLKEMARKGRQFDIVLLDPPYGRGYEREAVTYIDALNLLAENGRIVIEHGRNTAMVFDPDYDVKTRRYGDTCVSIIFRPL